MSYHPSHKSALLQAAYAVDGGRVHGVFPNGIYHAYGKRMLDLTVTVLLLPIAVPVVALAVLALWLCGVTPFYSQLRLGRNGQSFRLWKLRTMRPDADAVLEQILRADPAKRAEWDATQKLKDDPRVTRLGHILRKTSLDEVPQFLNVLRGDMSLLGPRPIMLCQRSLYGPTLSVYTAMRPGISGLWQVTERNDAEFARRAEIDVVYARNLSLRSDLRLIWQTIRTMLRSTGF
ncbi:MAG: sugar transferase [Rhodobacteraceae bacterium]|nr:sugar transferase [Paracoccaceae bacterium]